MKDKTGLQYWPKAAIPEVGLVVSRWTAAKAGAIASLWPAAPRLSHYIEEMMNAHSHSVTGKGYGL